METDDILTNLPSRALFLEELRRSQARATRRPNDLSAVLLLDLDRFKVINESLGHNSGDQFLAEIAQRLRVSFRVEDTVARFGGDKYLILLEDIQNIRDIMCCVERIREVLGHAINLSGHELFTSAGIGIALSSPQYARPEDLLRDAEIALNRAKAQGCGQYAIFDAAMHEQAVNLLNLETDLRRAIARKEFQLQYQPIVLLNTGRVASFEALIRWQHPGRGLVYPLEFISLAEETGLILPISQWVLQEACRQLAIWREQLPKEPGLSMGVNWTTKCLQQPDLVPEILEILSQYGLDPSHLTLEITESQIMENPELMSKVLLELHGSGVRVGIDDFGTGYSSLSYLASFPVHALKVDRSFLGKLTEDERNQAIVRTIVSLGKNLGMDVIAEGLETFAQLEFLQANCCPYGQGYYFAPPLDTTTADWFIERMSSQCSIDHRRSQGAHSPGSSLHRFEE